MSMYGRHSWGDPLEIHITDSTTDNEHNRNLQELDRGALDETQQSWILGAREHTKKKERYVDMGCVIANCKVFIWTLDILTVFVFLAGFITLIVKTVPRHHHKSPPPDNYTITLLKANLFFKAQEVGKLPRHNNVSWRGNFGLQNDKGDRVPLVTRLRFRQGDPNFDFLAKRV